MKVSANTITARSLFSILLRSVGVGTFIFFIVAGLFAMFGSPVVKLNGNEITGVTGFFVTCLFGVLAAFVHVLMLWIVGIVGLYVHSRFRDLSISFKGVREPDA